MRLSSKLLIVSLFFLLTASLTIIVVVDNHMREQAVLVAEQKAKILLKDRQAIIQYYTKNLRPPLFQLLDAHDIPEDYFEPAWMSAGHANRNIFKYFRNDGFEAFYYKNAAINARSEDNEANEYEVEFLEQAKDGYGPSTWSGLMEFSGEPHYVYMELNKQRFTEFCMRCHSSPDRAPAGLVQLYGSERAFHRNLGDIPSVISIRLPLKEAYANVDKMTTKLSIALVVIVGLSYISHWLVANVYLLKPINIFRNQVLDIAHGKKDIGPIHVGGGHEIDELSRAFNTMSSQLQENRDNLELLIQQRTAQLNSTNLNLLQEVQERERAEKKLREQERFITTVLDNLPIGVAVHTTDNDLKFHYMNDNYTSLYGTTKAHLISSGYGFWEGLFQEPLLNEQFRAHFELDTERAPAASFSWEDIPIDRSEGATSYITARKVPLHLEQAMISIVWDVTERKIMESKLVEAQKMDSIGNLAGGIAHDFNNLLVPIIGMSELLKMDLPRESSQYENANEILRAGKRGKELVGQILAFSRQSDHKILPFNFQQVVDEVVRLVRSIIPVNIAINVEQIDDCGFINGDPSQIHQVLMNLITNAFHAVEAEGGEIILSLRQKIFTYFDTISGLPPGSYLEIAITDTGHGIPDHIVDRIFDPYFTTKKQGKGTGMGLAVAYGIITFHSGMITVSSTEGEGATFTVYLPVIDPVPSRQFPHQVEQLPTGTERILLVDDENPVLNFATQMLERLGYTVTAYMDSTEALSAFLCKPDDYDLVITDATMPGITGDQLAKHIRSRHSAIPIIVCTGFSEKINRLSMADTGIQGYLMKPIVRSELAHMIRQILD